MGKRHLRSNAEVGDEGNTKLSGGKTGGSKNKRKIPPPPFIQPWIYRGSPLLTPPEEEGIIGFVYAIRYLGNKVPQKVYYGQKVFVHKTSRRAPKKQQLTVKGKPRKKIVRIRGVKPSDWETYRGSHIPLQDLFLEEPPHLFIREVLAFARSKQELCLLENKLLYCGCLDCPSVLEDPTSFNAWIGSNKIYKHQLVPK